MDYDRIVSPSQLKEYRSRRNLPELMPTPLGSGREHAPALFEYHCQKFSEVSRRAGFFLELGAINMQQDTTTRIQKEILHRVAAGELSPADQDVMDDEIVRTIDRQIGRLAREAYLNGAVLMRRDADGIEQRQISGDIPIYRGIARLALRDYVAGRTKSLPTVTPPSLPREFPWLEWLETAESLRRFIRPASMNYEIAVELLASARRFDLLPKILAKLSKSAHGREQAQQAASRVVDDLTFGCGSAPQLSPQHLEMLRIA